MRVTTTTLIILLALFAIPATSASVLVFSEYNTQATIAQDVIHVERDVTIRNTGQAPIIPGEMHFRFSEQIGDQLQAIDVSNVQAIDTNDNELQTRSVTRGNEQDVSVQIWDPLLPGFEYSFQMSYDLEMRTSGLLFHEINLPREQTTVPIVNEETRFLIADNYHVTYAPETEISRASGNTIIEWRGDIDNRVVEYSRIPFPRTGMRAVNVFWIAIIISLLAVFMLSFLRKKNSRGKRPPKQNNQQYQQPRNSYQQPQQQGYQQNYQQQQPTQHQEWGGQR